MLFEWEDFGIVLAFKGFMYDFAAPQVMSTVKIHILLFQGAKFGEVFSTFTSQQLLDDLDMFPSSMHRRTIFQDSKVRKTQGFQGVFRRIKRCQG